MSGVSAAIVYFHNNLLLACVPAEPFSAAELPCIGVNRSVWCIHLCIYHTSRRMTCESYRTIWITKAVVVEAAKAISTPLMLKVIFSLHCHCEAGDTIFA